MKKKRKLTQYTLFNGPETVIEGATRPKEDPRQGRLWERLANPLVAQIPKHKKKGGDTNDNLRSNNADRGNSSSHSRMTDK